MKKILLPFLCLSFSSAFSQTLMQYIYSGGLQRDYYVHLPPNFSNSEHLPLVFNLHGSTSNGAEQEYYSRMSVTSDSNNFIVVYPDGIGSEWNVGFNSPFNSGVDDVAFISNLIDTLVQLYNIDLTRVYSCGMSDGGFMSHRLACELENRIVAIVAVAGLPTDSVAFYCTHTRNVPVLQMHGTADPLVPYAGIQSGDTGFYSVEQTIDFWLNKDQCSLVNDTTFLPDINTHDSSTVQKIHYASCGATSEVLFYKIIGGGHSWPNAPLDYIYGPTNRDIDASQEIWNFFKQFSNIAASINELAVNVDLKIYPNPFTTQLKLESSEIIERIELTNVLGEKILEQKVSSNNPTINLPYLTDGVYFVKVEGDGFQQVRKVVK
ncbi:MAG: hypothetical protein JWO06_2355 [Bacteroidota bacterium]|nr:hypothetical protein [Bacteroidota bacterium]